MGQQILTKINRLIFHGQIKQIWVNCPGVWPSIPGDCDQVQCRHIMLNLLFVIRLMLQDVFSLAWPDRGVIVHTSTVQRCLNIQGLYGRFRMKLEEETSSEVIVWISWVVLRCFMTSDEGWRPTSEGLYPTGWRQEAEGVHFKTLNCKFLMFRHNLKYGQALTTKASLVCK